MKTDKHTKTPVPDALSEDGNDLGKPSAVNVNAGSGPGLRALLAPTVKDRETRFLFEKLLESPGTLRDSADESARSNHHEPVLDSPSSLLPSGAPLPAEPLERYRVGSLIGSGGAGEIYLVHDRDLDRDIALKVMRTGEKTTHTSVEQFTKEARTVAALEHPNVVPIYDLGTAKNGVPFFTMRRIQGKTLADSIAAAVKGDAVPENISSHSGLVAIFVSVCEALSYAHHKGHLHLDVKPQNIMIGDFGEVLLLDWGCSSGSGKRIEYPGNRPLLGTPLYMSPEQARREPPDERSDVYCVGASIFHALLLRPPVWAAHADEFWEKKKNGIIDSPTQAEAGRLPHQLLAIVTKAIEADPSQRYQSVKDLLGELRAFQAGLAIGWRQLHQKPLTTRAALKSQWRISKSHRWGVPEECDAGDGDLPWISKGDLMRGNCHPGYACLTYRQAILGNIRVGWRVRCVNGNQNLNAFIAGENRFTAYMFHVGGFGSNSRVVLTKAGPDNIVDVQTLPHPLEQGKQYTLVLEKVGDRIGLSIDGVRVIDYLDPDSLAGTGHQSFGFECCNNNTLEITDIHACYQPLPIMLSPLTVAGHYFEDQLFDSAILQYDEIIRAYPDTEMSSIALFKRAVARMKIGLPDEAVRDFIHFEKSCPAHQLVPLSMYERSRMLLAVGRDTEAERLCRILGRKYPGHAVLRRILYNATGHLLKKFSKDTMESGRRYIVRLGKISGVPVCDNEYLVHSASLLNTLGRHNEVLENYADQEGCCITALRMLGRHEEILSRYSHNRKACSFALLELARYQKVLDRYPEQEDHVAGALNAMGKHDEVLKRFAGQRLQCAAALSDMGKHNEVIEKYSDAIWEVTRALYRSNRLEDVLARFNNSRDVCAWALNKMGLYERVLREYPDQGSEYAIALLMTGQYRQLAIRLSQNNFRRAYASALIRRGRDERVLREFPLARNECAAILLRRGEFETVLDNYPEIIFSRMIALVGMGRAEELPRYFPSAAHKFGSVALDCDLPSIVLDLCPDQPDLCATALRNLGRSREVVARYSSSRHEYLDALIDTGNAAQAATKSPAHDNPLFRALIFLGRLDECIKRSATAWNVPNLFLDSLIYRGHFDRVSERYAAFRNFCADALMCQGAFDTVIRSFHDAPEKRCQALMYAGRSNQVLQACGHDPRQWRAREWAGYYAALLNCIRGKTTDAFRQLDKLAESPAGASRESLMFCRCILGPVLRAIAEPDADRITLFGNCQRPKDILGQRPFHAAAFITGKMDETHYRAQPCKFRTLENLELYRAIKADIEGKLRAITLYRRYAGISLHKRGIDPVRDRFVQWRLETIDGR